MVAALVKSSRQVVPGSRQVAEGDKAFKDEKVRKVARLVTDRRSIAQIARYLGESETDVKRWKRLAHHVRLTA
jgi:hypothetical protein